MTPICKSFPRLRIIRADERPIRDPNLHSTPSDQITISLRPHLAGFRDHKLPLPAVFNFTEIQSTARTGATVNIIPLATSKEMELPIFDLYEESAAIVSAWRDVIIGGASLTIEHPVKPNLHKTSNQLFMVCNNAKSTHLSLTACGELRVKVNKNFPGFALREVCRNNRLQFVYICKSFLTCLHMGSHH